MKETREDKIKRLKDFIAGKIPITEVAPEKWYWWNCDNYDEIYTRRDIPGTKWTREEMETFMNSCPVNVKHIVFKLQPGCDPLPDDEDDREDAIGHQPINYS